MGLTFSRKTAKYLAVRSKNERIVTVSRYKILTVHRKSHYPIVTLLTVSRKKAKILTVNRKSHYPIVTLKILCKKEERRSRAGTEISSVNFDEVF